MTTETRVSAEKPRLYRARRTAKVSGFVLVSVCDDVPDASRRMLDPALRLFKHSASYEWGYGGSGPAQLALGILADHFLYHPGDVDRVRAHVARVDDITIDNADDAAARLHQVFKFGSIALIPQLTKVWSMTSAQIRSFLDALMITGEQPAKVLPYLGDLAPGVGVPHELCSCGGAMQFIPEIRGAPTRSCGSVGCPWIEVLHPEGRWARVNTREPIAEVMS